MREVKSVYLWISWLCLFASITGILRWIHIQPPKHKPHIPSDFATDDCNTEQEVVRRIQHEWVLRIAIKIFLVLSFAFLFLHMAFGWYYFLTPCVSRSVVKQLSRSYLQHSVQMPSTWATTGVCVCVCMTVPSAGRVWGFICVCIQCYSNTQTTNHTTDYETLKGSIDTKIGNVTVKCI